MVKSEQSWAGIFITKRADGTLMPASATPVGTLYVDGVEDEAIVTITGSNPYNWSLILPVLNTGQQVEIYITATVDGIDTGFIAAQAQVDNELDILTSRLTAARAAYLDKLNVAGTLANTSNADAFKADTILVPQNVWSYHTRLLTNIGSTVESPAIGEPLNIYRDTTVLISLTNLGAIGVDDKLWFTVKDSVEEPDENSIIQIDRLGLLYINGEPASQVEDGSITVLDDVLGNVEIKLAQRQAALLPLYEAYPAQWDIKILHSGIVSILNIGTLYIKGTPTRAIL